MELTHSELVEKITKALKSMDGNELADLYNREFGHGMTYLGDEQFEQEDTDPVNEHGMVHGDDFIYWPELEFPHYMIAFEKKDQQRELISFKTDKTRWLELRKLMPDLAIYFQPDGAGDHDAGTASKIHSYDVYRSRDVAVKQHPDREILVFAGHEIEEPHFIGMIK